MLDKSRDGSAENQTRGRWMRSENAIHCAMRPHFDFWSDHSSKSCAGTAFLLLRMEAVIFLQAWFSYWFFFDKNSFWRKTFGSNWFAVDWLRFRKKATTTTQRCVVRRCRQRRQRRSNRPTCRNENHNLSRRPIYCTHILQSHYAIIGKPNKWTENVIKLRLIHLSFLFFVVLACH